MPNIKRTGKLFRGFIIKDGTVTPSDEKINTVKHFPTLMNQAAVQSFLDLTSYFRKFIPKYAFIALPNLLKAKFCFADTEKRAFEQLREVLSKKPVLRIYNTEAETKLHTDASGLRSHPLTARR